MVGSTDWKKLLEYRLGVSEDIVETTILRMMEKVCTNRSSRFFFILRNYFEGGQQSILQLYKESTGRIKQNISWMVQGSRIT